MTRLGGVATSADLAELRDTTKADLAALKTELRVEWKADLDAAIAPLATKAEVKAEVKAEDEHTLNTPADTSTSWPRGCVVRFA